MSFEPITQLTGLCVPLLQDNIDTDQIIPSREMKRVSKTGLGEGLFAGQRYREGREENPECVLNQSQYEGATILLSGRNFGCGSSREHAVWALKDYGFRAIIAQSFGEIFYTNCIRNGLLPIELSEDIISELSGDITIDLGAQAVAGYPFEIEAGHKTLLLEGLDVIALTLGHSDEIATFITRDKHTRPWVYD